MYLYNNSDKLLYTVVILMIVKIFFTRLKLSFTRRIQMIRCYILFTALARVNWTPDSQTEKSIKGFEM